MACLAKCCGVLVYKPRCPICRLLAAGVVLLDWRGRVRLRAMTPAEFARYHRPVFEPDEAPSAVIVGFVRVAQRVWEELTR